MSVIKIKSNKPKTTFKGFGDSAKKAVQKDWRYYAIELNIEDIPAGEDGQPDLLQSEPVELLELHHIAFSPVRNKKEAKCLTTWALSMCDVYVSHYEILAELYAFSLNPRAEELGANVARIYHNSCLGDDRIHSNSIGHYYDGVPDGDLPKQAYQILHNHLSIQAIVPGHKVTLRNRLGN